jgi:hypothetical protein
MKYRLMVLAIAAFGLRDVVRKIIVWGNTVVWGS